MTTYQHDTVTVWVVHAPSEEHLAQVLTFEYGEGDANDSPFSAAFRTGFYDEDFAQYLLGESVEQVLTEAAETWLSLEEQVRPRLPFDGQWNALYIIASDAGADWQSETSRPLMPHGVVQINNVLFKLLGTFPVVARF